MNVYILSTCFTFFTFKTFSTFTISFQTVYVFGRTVSYMFPLRETLLVKNSPPLCEICGCGGGLLVVSANAPHLLEIYCCYFVCAADTQSVSDS